MEDNEIMEGEAPVDQNPLAQANPFDARVVRDTMADPSRARKALVDAWQDRIKKAKKHHEKYFTRMQQDQRFASGKQWPNDPEMAKYVVNICGRHVQQKTAALYAKNPTAVARVREQMDHILWDGKQETLQLMQQVVQMGMQTGTPINPQMQAVIDEATATMQMREMRKRFARTLELVYNWSLQEQPIPFKKGMKMTVRRAVTNAVAYVKLGFIRQLQPKPEITAQMNTIAERMAMIGRLSEDLADEEFDENSAEMEQLKLQLQMLQNEPEQIAREGLDIDYPRTNSILIDPECKNLSTFLGAEWVAQEYMLTEDRIEEIYNIDVGGKYRAYREIETKTDSPIWVPESSKQEEGEKFAAVYEIWSKKDGQVFVICDGFPDFIQEPAAPDVWTERFWPFFPLVMNDVEDEEEFFPKSDIRLMRHQQQELNRCREGMREHRIANRPAMAVAAGMLNDEDKQKLVNRPANAVIELQGLAPQQTVDSLLQTIKPPGLDPNLYETGPVFQDVQFAIGAQPADLGGVSSDTTATESSIAASARDNAMGSEMDDMDTLLTEFARAAGQILMANMSEETVKKVCGPGAVWPQLSRAELAQEVNLEIEMGSSGRPNKAQDIQNMQTMLPLIMQLPGVDPMFLVKECLRRMDDRLNIEEALKQGAPSIQAMNQMAAKPSPAPTGPGEAGESPEQQGAEGANNAPNPEGSAPDLSQDQFPAPGAHPALPM